MDSILQLFNVLFTAPHALPSPNSTPSNPHTSHCSSQPPTAPAPVSPTISAIPILAPNIPSTTPPAASSLLAATSTPADLPHDALELILQRCDPETLVRSVPAVCRSWREAARSLGVWRQWLSPVLLAQLEPLSRLGPPLQPAHLFLAACGRNLLRNPSFRRDANTTPAGGQPGAAGSGKWQREAWVITAAPGEGLAWELPPAGIKLYGSKKYSSNGSTAASSGSSTAAATEECSLPPPPLPYPVGSRYLSSTLNTRASPASLSSTLSSWMPFSPSSLLLFSSCSPSAAASLRGPAPPPPLQQQKQQQQRPPQQQPLLQLPSLFGTGSGGLGNGNGNGNGGCRSSSIGGSRYFGRAAPGEFRQQQQGCLATSKDWCEVVQVIDLQGELVSRGLSGAQAAQLLDAGLGMRLSVHVGSRWDCVGQFSVGLLLDEGTGNANGYSGGGSGRPMGREQHSSGHHDAATFPSLQSFVMRPTRHHFYMGPVMCTSDCWQRFCYSLPACPPGCRRAVVVLRGRRAPSSLLVSPLPRHCGAKFAAAELVLL
ncbi:hypothetical protein Agub_g15692 [Astrephomene gubernaculifera]|uniref:F-box domain-containing protein n=1 Tax=Astrephomene gubernaculifera TaxID=47775 RepID=A0AAD3HUD9_9CHLO|nr:hypothetical protein Agub_g15692 [Astrephomene gubernaculifera]